MTKTNPDTFQTVTMPTGGRGPRPKSVKKRTPFSSSGKSLSVRSERPVNKNK